MLIFEWTLLLLAAAAGLAALARRWRAPYPSLLALLGAALVFLPGAPSFVLQPELVLALFVAPVLLDAAYDTSIRDLRDNWAPIAGLVLVAVGATTAVVAVVTKALMPELPWAAAIALGAIVAPPDAAAATAVLRSAPLPHRLLKILEGESLLNDATALLIYRFAVSAATGATLTVSGTLPVLAAVTIGSLATGAALAWVALQVTRRIEDPPTAVIFQFTGTFAVWILAERVGLSGILTVVVYAIGIAQVAPLSTPARVRLPSYAVWATLTFVLNALAFVLIGLQLGPIFSRLSAADRSHYLIVAIAVLGAVIGTRIVWVMSANAAVRWKVRRFGMSPPGRPKGDNRSAQHEGAQRSTRRPLLEPTIRGGIVISWCGMRGIVTIAAALGLPDGERPFPGRDLILVAAFVVVLGTLVVQGLTLRPLLLALDLDDDHPVEREAALARAAALEGAMACLEGDESAQADALRFEYRELWSSSQGDGSAPPGGSAFAAAGAARPARGKTLAHLRLRTVAAARARIAALRTDGSIGDDAYHRIEAELDRAEVYAESLIDAAA